MSANDSRSAAPGPLLAPTVIRDRLFVNDERTVLVRIWATGTIEVARRESPDHTWGPPVYLKEEK